MIPKKPSSLYKQVSEDLDIEQILVENFVDFYYKKIRECVSNMTHPRINLEGLGHFIAKTSAVKKSISRCKKSLDNHDTSTFGAYFNKKRIELKLDQLIALEEKLLSEEYKRETFKKEKDEKYIKANLGEQEPNN
jgi:nucleoid DNA-binding protein